MNIVKHSRRLISRPLTRIRRTGAGWLLRHHATALRRRLANANSLDERVAAARSCQPLRSNQKPGEITSLLERLDAMRPALVCEIGSDRGGTLALIASSARSGAEFLSIDLCFSISRHRVYHLLMHPTQRVTCLEADSHSPRTLDRVVDWLRGRKFDFLFIDGDHTYDGVKRDYEMYAPLVRPGGIIAFHDIVPDFRTRFGVPTPRDVGEVPRFWSELKANPPGRLEELVEDPDQDGYGIGVLWVEPPSRVEHAQ